MRRQEEVKVEKEEGLEHLGLPWSPDPAFSAKIEPTWAAQNPTSPAPWDIQASPTSPSLEESPLPPWAGGGSPRARRNPAHTDFGCVHRRCPGTPGYGQQTQNTNSVGLIPALFS